MAPSKEPLAVLHTEESHKDKQVQQRVGHKQLVEVPMEMTDQRKVPQPSGHTLPQG